MASLAIVAQAPLVAVGQLVVDSNQKLSSILDTYQQQVDDVDCRYYRPWHA